MKTAIPSLAVTAVLALFLTTRAGAESVPAGHVDFGTFRPPASGGEFVEVNLSSGILAIAARLVPREEADVARVLSGLHQVRVNVIGLDDGNRAEIVERIGKIRAALTAQGWERIVTAQKKAEDVGIYLKTQGKESIAGLAVIVLEGKEAVFVNVVGDIRVEDLAVIGERLHIDPLTKIGRGTEKKSSAAGE